MELPDLPTRTYVLAGALALVAVGAAVWFLFLSGDGDDPVAAPAAWAAEIEPLVTFVESQRGAAFAQPVAVDLVDRAGLEAMVGLDEGVSEADAAHLQRSVDVLRAFNLITDRRDDDSIIAEAAPAALVGNRTVVYLADQRRIAVVGDDLGDLDVVTEIELVGALGEALHAQYFPFSTASPLDSSTEVVGPRAVAAGVGPVFIDRYVADLPARQQAAWEAHTQLDRGTDAASVLAGLVSVPDRLGEALMRLAVADTVTDGSGPTWERFDALLSAPPRTELELLQPWAALDGFERVAVTAPVPAEGAEVLAEGRLGASSLYLALGLRIDPREALAVSLTWAGDAMVLTRDESGRRCIEVAVEGRDGDASDRYEEAMREWVSAGPRQADASVEREGRAVTLRSCEASAGAATGIELDPATVVAVAGNRTNLLADLRLEDSTRNSAVCTADLVLEAIPVSALQATEVPPEAQNVYDLLLTNSRRSCRNL